MTGNALFARHGECARDCRTHRLGIIGIDQQGRRAEFSRGARKSGQHEHARIFGILRCDVLLGHQIHSVAERRYEPDARGAIQA